MTRIASWVAGLVRGMPIRVAAGLIVVWIYRVPLAERAAGLALARAGLTDIAFTVREVSLGTARVDGIDLGPDLPALDTVTLRYSAAGLLNGRLEAITVSGLSYTYDLDAPAKTTPPAPAPETGPNRLAQTAAILERLQVLIELTDAAVTIRSVPGVGSLALQAEASLDFRQGPGRITLNLKHRDTTKPAGAGSQGHMLAWRADGSLADGRLTLSGPAVLLVSDLPVAGWTVGNAGYEGAFALDLGATDLRIAADSGLDISAFQGSSAGGTPSVSGRLERPALTLDGRPGGTNVLTVDDGTVTLPESRIGLSGLRARVPFRGGTLEGAVEAHARVRQTGPAPLFPPHVQTVSLQRTPGGAFEITGTLTLPNGGGAAPIAGTFDPVTQAGRVRLGPATVRFTPGGLQPAGLSGALKTLSDVRGPVGLTATARRTPSGAMRASANLVLSGVDLTLPTGTGIEGLEGTLDLVGPDPVRTEKTQTLTARRITGPFPLEMPRLRFGLTVEGASPVIAVKEATGGFAGGTVSLEPFTYRADRDANTLSIGVQALSLGRLLDEWAAGRVSGEGLLTGRIPVRLSPEGAVIADGRIRAEKAGVIRVKWGEAREAMLAQGDEVGLMVRALEDFRFNRLEVGLSRPSDGQLALAITLAGNNPAVLDAQPFVFNITLSGNLEDLLSALSAGQGLTADLLRGRLGR